MANAKKRVPENVPGDFFVDSTCINCDACRQIALSVFGEAASTSFVKAQPVASAGRRHALQALLACPTGSIGCLGDDDVKAVMKDFPLVVEEPVFYCGYNEFVDFCERVEHEVSSPDRLQCAAPGDELVDHRVNFALMARIWLELAEVL